MELKKLILFHPLRSEVKLYRLYYHIIIILILFTFFWNPLLSQLVADLALGNVTDSIPVLNRDLGERLGPVCNLINTYLHSETNRKKNETENDFFRMHIDSSTLILQPKI
jgi:hypothetical protein